MDFKWIGFLIKWIGLVQKWIGSRKLDFLPTLNLNRGPTSYKLLELAFDF